MVGIIQNDRTSIEQEAQLSPWWIVIAFVLLGLLLFCLNETQALALDRTFLMFGVLLLFAAAAVTGLLTHWYSWAACWFTVLFLMTFLLLALRWFALPGMIVLLALPIVLAMAVLGLRAAIVATVIQSLAVLLVRHWHVELFSASDLVLTISGNWLTLTLLAAPYRLWQQTLRMLWHNYEQTRLLLDEARTRNQTLDQTLDDLLHANRQLDLLNERLAALRLAAEEAQHAKAAFVAKVSHEFRTPLNMIIGLTDLLIETPEVYGEKLPARLLHDLEIVHRNCAHLASMIDDVLDLSQAEAVRLTLHKEWVDLGEDIQISVAVVEPLLQKKSLALEVRMPHELPNLYCDRKRIRQVILNLLSNAARYTEEGGITIEVTVQPNDVRICIADTGPGIHGEDTQRIFEPFFQTHDSHRKGHTGSGLGLTISKQFIEMHNGTLWVESELGVGSSFYLTLPRSQPTLPLARAGRWIGEGWMWQERVLRAPLPNLPHRPRMVVCDTSGGLAPLFANLGDVVTDNIEVVEHFTLGEALHECQTCPSHLLLINTPMPELWTAVEQARNSVPDTPIVATAILSSLDTILETSVLEYLIKPVTRADISAALQLVTSPLQRVLVVDDEDEVRDLLIRMLLACDDRLEIFEAATGEEALGLLRTHHPDLLLLDMMLPDMTGVHVLDQKLREPAICGIPTVVISAQDPIGQPMTSNFLVTTLAGGVSFEKMLQCAMKFSQVMLSAPAATFPASAQTPVGAPAWSDKA